MKLSECNFILHLGAHRTGTTSIQYALDQNSHSLLQEGIVCLTPPRMGKRNETTIRRIAGALPKLGRRFSYVLPWVLAIRQKSVLEELMIEQSQGKPFSSVIVSEENFMGDAFAMVGKSDLLYPDLANRLRGLKRVFGSSISRLHICIRSYETFLPSYYAKVAMYGKGRDFESIKARWMRFEGGWPSVIQRIAEHLPDARLRVTTFESATPEETFWEIIGSQRLRERLSWSAEALNQAPTCEAIQAALRLKGTTNFDPDEIIHLSRDGKRFDPLSREEKLLLSDRYASDLEALCRWGLVERLKGPPSQRASLRERLQRALSARSF